MPKYIPSLGVSKFTELEDAPKSYSGQGGKIVQVKLDESGLEFSNSPFIWLFGDGSDGDVTITANTTLTRDMFYNNLTVNSGVVLNTGGYRIFVKGTLTNNGTIRNNGSNGSVSTGGAGAPAGTLGGGGKGGDGVYYSSSIYGGGGGGGGGVVFIAARSLVNNGIIEANGGNGANAGPLGSGIGSTYGYGQAGESILGGGGNGGAGGYSGSYSGGAGGVVTTYSRNYKIPPFILFESRIFGGGGGGGGGSLSSTNYGGGGGGGGGGLVIIYYRTATWGTERALGGAGGTSPGGSSQYGASGASGSVIKIQV